MVKLNLVCGLWLQWHACLMRVKRMRILHQQRSLRSLLKTWLCTAFVFAGQREALGRVNRRQKKTTFRKWVQTCKDRDAQLSAAVGEYTSLFMEGQTLLVRPALYSWRRFAYVGSLLRSHFRLSCRRHASRWLRAWGSKVVTDKLMTVTVRAARTRQNSRLARCSWVAWLSFGRYCGAMRQVLAAAARQRWRKRMRAWCVYALRRLALRDAAR